jgi:hypothetical protein
VPPVDLLTAANTGVLKSKTPLTRRLPGITIRLLHEYLKKFSRMHIISHWLRENQARLCLLLAACSTVWKPFPF